LSLPIQLHGANNDPDITHKDEYDNVAESWSFPGKQEDVLAYVKGWNERIHDVVMATPKSQLVDYKLVWRDPLPTWVSKHARIILIGDSAHPFLPTSAQGAGQAVEDGATVAICLELAGKDNVPLALKTCERLRYILASQHSQPCSTDADGTSGMLVPR
jgi:2-polyprenyl-6-methoxyphenol hydroxylase-like FAD-dependent oxidoreductase